MRRLFGVIAALGVAAAIVPASAPGATNAFEGTCALSGRLTFDKPLGNELRTTGFRDSAIGTCTGTLNGDGQQNAPVVIRAKGAGTLSCLAGHTTSAGTLTFTRGTEQESDDVKIGFVTDTTGGLTQFVSRFRGSVSGEGIAYVSVLPYADQSTLVACQAGTLGSAPYDLTARTVTPMVG